MTLLVDQIVEIAQRRKHALENEGMIPAGFVLGTDAYASLMIGLQLLGVPRYARTGGRDTLFGLPVLCDPLLPAEAIHALPEPSEAAMRPDAVRHINQGEEGSGYQEREEQWHGGEGTP